MTSLNALNTYSPLVMSSESKVYVNMNKYKTSVEVLLEIINGKSTQEGIQSKVFLLKALTGSGKSTGFIHELFTYYGKSIYCTQPKKILCINNTSSICSIFKDMQLSYNIGYSIGNYDTGVSTNDHIMFATIQKLSNMLSLTEMKYG